MNMPEKSREPRSITLSLSPADQWTLHHVLLDRIEQESTAEDPANIDPPPVAVFQSFEMLDSGERDFTITQLEAIRTVLGEYHHSTTWWELERSQLEQLLHHVSELVEQQYRALPAKRGTGGTFGK